MKTYYYIKRGEFANQYDLCHAPSAEKLPEEWERIPRRDAIRYAAQEADRREYNNAMSGYAPALVMPYGMSEMDIDPYDRDVTYTIEDRIVRLL